MLKLIRATDPISIKSATLTIYGPPGVGKTSLAFTAQRPLLLDFDGAAYRAHRRGTIAKIDAWTDIERLAKEDLKDYDTIIVDTVGRALDTLSDDIRQDPKLGRGNRLTLEGYGVLKSRYTTWVHSLRKLDKNLVFIAHMDEQQRGDDIVERIDASGASKREVYKLSDAMGRMYATKAGRLLNCDPTDTAYGKNPGLGEMPLSIEDNSTDYMGTLINRILSVINTNGGGGVKTDPALEAWRGTFEKILTVKDANDAIDLIAGEPPTVKRLLVSVMKLKGLRFDAAAKMFVGSI